jgi:hypothetical protein
MYHGMVPVQERLHRKMDSLLAKTSPRKPSIQGASELAALRENLDAREGEAAMLREQARNPLQPPPKD